MGGSVATLRAQVMLAGSFRSGLGQDASSSPQSKRYFQCSFKEMTGLLPVRIYSGDREQHRQALPVAS